MAKKYQKKMRETIIRANIREWLVVDISIDGALIKVVTDDENLKTDIMTLWTKYMNARRVFIQKEWNKFISKSF